MKRPRRANDGVQRLGDEGHDPPFVPRGRESTHKCHALYIWVAIQVDTGHMSGVVTKKNDIFNGKTTSSVPRRVGPLENQTARQLHACWSLTSPAFGGCQPDPAAGQWRHQGATLGRVPWGASAGGCSSSMLAGDNSCGSAWLVCMWFAGRNLNGLTAFLRTLKPSNHRTTKPPNHQPTNPPTHQTDRERRLFLAH